jgi:hypothetical protein
MYHLAFFSILAVIVRNIWQKLSSVEREMILIVRNFWQLFSRICGETLLLVTNDWRNFLPDFLAIGFRLELDAIDVSFRSLAAPVCCERIRQVALTPHVA